MTCPACRLDGFAVPLGTGWPPLIPSSPDRICPRCGSEYVAGPGGAPLFARRRVWMPLFGWVTREEFDEMLPPFTARRGGIQYVRSAP